MDNDLFAPPTKDELTQVQTAGGGADLFAPPTKDELASVQPSWLDKHVPVVGGTPRGYIQGGLNTLPMAGAFGGGVLGGTAGIAAGPVGTIAAGTGGAALGGATGEGLKKLGEHYILGQDDQKPGDYVRAEAHGLLNGATQELGGQVGSKALKVVGDVPELLREIGAGPAKAESAIYDPFLKTSRVPGQSVNDLENIGTAIDQGKSAAPSLGQRAAGAASKAIDKTSEVAGKTAEVAGKALPYVAKVVGAALGHFPGYAAAEALTSPAGKAAVKATGLIAKDAAGNIIASPEGMGLLMSASKGQTSKNE